MIKMTYVDAINNALEILDTAMATDNTMFPNMGETAEKLETLKVQLLKRENKMTNELKCPHCNSTAVVLHDCYDTIYGENDTIKELMCGCCTNCGADLQWDKVYKFVGYDKIEES